MWGSDDYSQIPGVLSVICFLVTDSGTRRFSLITSGDVAVKDRPGERVQPEPGLADVLMLQRQTAVPASVEAERALFQDSLAEYVWARDVASLSPRTL